MSASFGLLDLAGLSESGTSVPGCITTELSDAGPTVHRLTPQRNPGLTCSRFVRRSAFDFGSIESRAEGATTQQPTGSALGNRPQPTTPALSRAPAPADGARQRAHLAAAQRRVHRSFR